MEIKFIVFFDDTFRVSLRLIIFFDEEFAKSSSFDEEFSILHHIFIFLKYDEDLH